ncbi:MAG: trigger factor [Nitrospirota bacterium]
MKVAVEDISAVQKKLTIEIEPDIVTNKIEKALADIARKAKIPGFRPGKAPKAIVEKRFHDEILSETLQQLVSESYFKALQEKNLNPVNMPAFDNISELSKGSALSFSASVEVKPHIELRTYDGIEVKESEIAVTDDEIGQTMNRIAEMYAQLEVVEAKPLENGNVAIIDFEGFQDGKPIESAKASGHMLTLGTDSLIPGFEDQLIGMIKDETREINVTFPEDYTNKDLAGKNALFKVTLKEIKKKILPELNDEFAKNLGDYKTLDEFKDVIRKDIENRKKSDQLMSQRADILSNLVETHTFEIPPVLVKHELLFMARQQASRMVRMGMDVQKSFNVDKFKEDNTIQAEKNVKARLILDEIADKEKIDVSDQEVNAELALMAKNARKTVAELRKQYDSLEGGLDNLKSSLIQEKVLALLLSRSKKSYNILSE